MQHIVDGLIQRPQFHILILGATDKVVLVDGQPRHCVHVRRLEGRQCLQGADVHSADVVVAGAVVECRRG